MSALDFDRRERIVGGPSRGFFSSKLGSAQPIPLQEARQSLPFAKMDPQKPPWPSHFTAMKDPTRETSPALSS